MANTTPDDVRAALCRLVLPGGVRVVYQPIVRLADGEVVGYEALARMDVERGVGPSRWLEAATRMGMRTELELACWAAVAHGGPPPADRLLFVNTSPDLLADPRVRALRGDLPDRLVIELTEEHAVSDYDTLREQLSSWTAEGARLAIDDLGSGYASLRHVLQLEPEFLKLDCSLISGIDRSPAQRAMASALLSFAREVGSTVIAEGVEAPGELATLRDMGVHLAQGYLLARPGNPWPADPVRPVHRRTRALASEAEAARLERLLHAATDSRQACDAVADHLSRRGGLMPSLYLERDGLLRCQAQRGLWQVLDGMPASSGLTGRAFRTGRAVRLADAASAADYLEAIPGVAAELCVPLRVAGTSVGALNVESLSALSQADELEVERCARRLGAHLERLGTGRRPSALGRMAQASYRLLGLGDPDDLRRQLVVQAAEVTGMCSAVLALDEGAGLQVVTATGPLAPAMLGLTHDELDTLAAVVAQVASCHSSGEATGRTVAGTERLRRGGARALAVTPVLRHGERLGVLVVAHDSTRRLGEEDAEAFELLAALAGGALDLADTMAELHDLAVLDPLTGLGNHRAFHDHVGALEVGDAVLLADIDRFKQVNDTFGHLVGDQTLRTVAAGLAAGVRAEDRAYRIGGDEFAIVIHRGASLDVAAMGDRLCRRATEALGRMGAGLSAGACVPRPGEGPTSFLARADAALYDAKRNQRGQVVVAGASTALLADLDDVLSPMTTVPEERRTPLSQDCPA